MADNYLQFSEVIANLTEPEEAWLKEQLQPIRVFGEKEYPEDAVPAELADTEADWTGVRFLRDNGDCDPEWDALGFEYNFHDDHDYRRLGSPLVGLRGRIWEPRQRCVVGAEVSQEVPARPVLVAHLRRHLLKAARRRVRRRRHVRHGRTRSSGRTPTTSLKKQRTAFEAKQDEERKESMSRSYDMTVEISGHDPERRPKSRRRQKRNGPLPTGGFWR